MINVLIAYLSIIYFSLTFIKTNTNVQLEIKYKALFFLKTIYLNNLSMHYLFHSTINVRTSHIRSIKWFDGSEFPNECKHTDHKRYFLPIFHFYSMKKHLYKS